MQASHWCRRPGSHYESLVFRHGLNSIGYTYRLTRFICSGSWPVSTKCVVKFGLWLPDFVKDSVLRKFIIMEINCLILRFTAWGPAFNLANLINITIICYTKVGLLLYHEPSLHSPRGLCPVNIVTIVFNDFVLSPVPAKARSGFFSIS